MMKLPRPATLRATVLSLALSVGLCHGVHAATPSPLLNSPAPATQAIERVSPACVQILGAAASRPQLAYVKNFDGEHLGRQPVLLEAPQTNGSGVIVDAVAGIVLTNHHVIDALDEVVVRLQDGREVPARIVGSDPQTDVAVLRIEADKLQAISPVSPGTVRPGDPVIALGSPMRLRFYASLGTVGAPRVRAFADDPAEYVAHDAAILAGNSGGPLVTLEGKLVGLNARVLADNTGYISLAVPAEVALRVAERILVHGKLPRGEHGLQLRDAAESSLRKRAARAVEGVVVEAVDPGSAAAVNGLRAGMTVTDINGQPVRSATDLDLRLAMAAPGERITLGLATRTGPSSITFSLQFPDTDPMIGIPQEVSEVLGVITRRDETSFPVVEELDPQGLGARMGLQTGDLIEAVLDEPISSLGEVELLVMHLARETEDDSGLDDTVWLPSPVPAGTEGDSDRPNYDKPSSREEVDLTERTTAYLMVVRDGRKVRLPAQDLAIESTSYR